MRQTDASLVDEVPGASSGSSLAANQSNNQPNKTSFGYMNNKVESEVVANPTDMVQMVSFGGSIKMNAKETVPGELLT